MAHASPATARGQRVEARQLTGAADARTAARTLAEAALGAVVTLGGDGALVAEEGRCEHTPAPAVTVIDTTGAGDAFRGVLAAELAHGRPLARAAATATAAGAFAVTALGARGALPRPRDLSAYAPANLRIPHDSHDSHERSTAMPALPLIIDTDTGSDDAVALLLAAASGVSDSGR